MKVLVCGAVALQAVVTPALAGWTAIRLHPEGADFSEVHGVRPARQGGFMSPSPGQTQAGFWEGGAGAWTTLSPPEFSSFVYGMDATRQVGQLFGAALWYGTPESRVDLHPAGASFSEARAVAGEMQVGHITLPGPTGLDRAALWRGTAASFVDLHPAGALRSFAHATDGVYQGGEAIWSTGARRAALWSGSAQSHVDLHPAGAITSAIRGMAPGVQVGEVRPGGVLNPHAAVWNGAAESWRDLHPAGDSGLSRLYATTGTVHVGDFASSSQTFARAAINFGTPDSWLSLHQFLPPEYSSFSLATSVYQDGDTIYVGGWASGPSLQSHAFLWVGTVPAPGAGALLLAAGIIAARRRR